MREIENKYIFYCNFFFSLDFILYYFLCRQIYVIIGFIIINIIIKPIIEVYYILWK